MPWKRSKGPAWQRAQQQVAGTLINESSKDRLTILSLSLPQLADLCQPRIFFVLLLYYTGRYHVCASPSHFLGYILLYTYVLCCAVAIRWWFIQNRSQKRKQKEHALKEKKEMRGAFIWDIYKCWPYLILPGRLNIGMWNYLIHTCWLIR